MPEKRSGMHMQVGGFLAPLDTRGVFERAHLPHGVRRGQTLGQAGGDGASQRAAGAVAVARSAYQDSAY